MKSAGLKLSLSIIIALIFSIRLTAQDTSKSVLSTKKYAIQFQVDDLLNLSSFEGSIFSAKYNFNEDNSLRFGISFNIRNTTRKLDTIGVGTMPGVDDKITDYTIGVNLHYLHNNYLYNRINFFYGLGPRIYYSNSQSTYFHQVSKQFELGNDFLGGVEWFFYKNFSLSGEYGFKISYIYRDEERPVGGNVRGNIIKNTEEGLFVSANNVKLGLSVYF